MSNPSKSDQIAKGLDLMLNADKREVAYAYRDAIVSDVGDMERELNEARAEREQCRVQLAGCGVIAGCNTRSTLAEQMPTPDAYGYSASLLDVAKAVTREMNERERAERAEAIAQGWAEAADRARQPDVFYKDYNEGTMRAMQALLSKASVKLSECMAHADAMHDVLAISTGGESRTAEAYRAWRAK